MQPRGTNESRDASGDVLRSISASVIRYPGDVLPDWSAQLSTWMTARRSTRTRTTGGASAEPNWLSSATRRSIKPGQTQGAELSSLDLSLECTRRVRLCQAKHESAAAQSHTNARRAQKGLGVDGAAFLKHGAIEGQVVRDPKALTLPQNESDQP